jgi:hypothetical protein
MKTKSPKTKLKLTAETLRQLAEADLKEAAGGEFSHLNTCTCHFSSPC